MEVSGDGTVSDDAVSLPKNTVKGQDSNNNKKKKKSSSGKRPPKEKKPEKKEKKPEKKPEKKRPSRKELGKPSVIEIGHIREPEQQSKDIPAKPAPPQPQPQPTQQPPQQLPQQPQPQPQPLPPQPAINNDKAKFYDPLPKSDETNQQARRDSSDDEDTLDIIQNAEGKAMWAKLFGEQVGPSSLSASCPSSLPSLPSLPLLPLLTLLISPLTVHPEFLCRVGQLHSSSGAGIEDRYRS